MAKTKKIYLMKPVKGYAYGPGTIEVPEKVAEDLLDTGKAREPKATLPEKLPHRDDFLKEGYETVAQIKEIDDFTKVSGIGKAGAKEVAEYFQK